MSDWSKDPGVQQWFQDVLDDMVPKLADSVVSISLVPQGRTTGDVKYWVELGASIMFDKPIIAVVTDDREIPERLLRVADEVVRLEHPFDDPRGAKQFMDALERVTKRLGIDLSDEAGT